MTRRKREITGLANEQDFPHLVELALPLGPFRRVFLEMDAFHRERRIPVRRGRNRYEVKQVYIRFCFPDTATADAPQSLRWRVLDLRTGEAQAADSVTRRMHSGDTGGRGRLAQREMATTQGKSPFVSGMVVLATLLIAAPAAHAACKSPKNICKHFDDCLQQTSDPNNKDADGIRAGVKARNGQIVLAGAEACARDLGRKQQWDKWARGCSALEFVQIARVELELGKVYCDGYSQ